LQEAATQLGNKIGQPQFYVKPGTQTGTGISAKTGLPNTVTVTPAVGTILNPTFSPAIVQTMATTQPFQEHDNSWEDWDNIPASPPIPVMTGSTVSPGDQLQGTTLLQELAMFYPQLTIPNLGSGDALGPAALRTLKAFAYLVTNFGNGET
jgi:hypothetical protein